MNIQRCPKCQKEFNVVRTFTNGEGELRTACGNCGVTLVPEVEVELTDDQVARCDEIYQSVYDCIKIITENPDLKYDISYIGDITETLVLEILKHPAIPDKAIHFPGVVTDEPSGSQHIEELVYQENPIS